MEIACVVEEKLGRERSLELDVMLADPGRWPKAIFDGWKLPPGPLPSRFRSWGGVKIGLEWCSARGVAVTKFQMNRHFRDHVPLVPYSIDDFVGKGTKTRPNAAAVAIRDPVSYMQVYENGLRVGNKAIDLLMKRVEAIEARGEEVPLALLTKLADLGTKLATSQAAIMARGANMGSDKDDEVEGFRRGSAPLPSERLGHSRIRVIDGEARPVRDEGPTDRAQYNERAREEGSPELPSPV